jgi:hypothetical protein
VPRHSRCCSSSVAIVVVVRRNNVVLLVSMVALVIIAYSASSGHSLRVHLWPLRLNLLMSGEDGVVD